MFVVPWMVPCCCTADIVNGKKKTLRRKNTLCRPNTKKNMKKMPNGSMCFFIYYDDSFMNASKCLLQIIIMFTNTCGFGIWGNGVSSSGFLAVI